MLGKAFISYRRSDTEWVAQSLYQQLRGRFGPGQLFMDVNAIEPGSRWPERLRAELTASTIVLVLVGPGWLSAADRYYRTVFTATELAGRVRAMQAACSDLRHELLERVDGADQVAIAFRLRGVHSGPLPTPLETVAATGRAFEVQVIDVLTLVDGRIGAITMVGDELGRLTSLGVLRLS